MRKVIVLVQATGKKSVVEGEIKTLADLKHFMDIQGVDYPSECEFKEAKTKTIFVDNDSVLPTNVEWKGEVSDDLIMYVTAPKKKIKSGVMNRKEAFEYIKNNNLQDAVKARFGRNFTQVSTDDLLKLIDSVLKKNDENPKKSEKKVVENKSNEETQTVVVDVDNLKDTIENLYGEDEITDYARKTLMNIISGNKEKVEKKKKALEDMSFEELTTEFKL